MNAGSSPVVSLQGQNLDLVPLQTFPNYTLYAADIASFAGQSATLSFTAPTPRFGSPSFLTLDDISFLPIAVPEPTTEALLALGGLVLVSRIRRRDR